MKGLCLFCLLLTILLEASQPVLSAAIEVDDLLKDNDNKTIIIRPDTTPTPTTIMPLGANLSNDTAVNSSPPVKTQSNLVETMTPSGLTVKPDTKQKIKVTTTASIDFTTNIINTTDNPKANVTENTNSISTPTSSSSFINETRKKIENTSTTPIVKDLEVKKINNTINRNEKETSVKVTTEQIIISSTNNNNNNVTASTNIPISNTIENKTISEKNETIDSAKKNPTKQIIQVFNVTESPTTQNTPNEVKQYNVTNGSILNSTETTKEISHLFENTTSSQELVAHPAEAISAEDQAVVIIGGISHPGEAQRLQQDAESMASLKKHENHDHPTSRGFFEPGMTAGIMASIFVGVAIFGYIGLILWRKMLEKRYGTREMLVNEDDFNDVNYMSNFEL